MREPVIGVGAISDPAPLFDRIDIRRTPLLPVAVGLILGIALQDSRPVGSIAWIALLVIGGAVACSWRVARRSLLGNVFGWAGVVAAASALGGLRQSAAERLPSNDLIRMLPRDREPLVRLRGVIATEPRVDPPPGPEVRRAYDTEPRTRFPLDVDSALVGEEWRELSGRIRVTLGAPALHLAAGQRVELLGRAYRLQPPGNPGQFDHAARSRREGIRAGLFCGSERNAVVIVEPGAAGWRGWIQRARRHLHLLLAADMIPSDDGSETLLDAMVLGQRGQVERSLDRAFIASGTVHFLCASGLNVAWLAMTVWCGAMIVGLNYRATALLCIAAVVSYAILAEPNPPIWRATLTACLFFASRWLRRPVRGGNWLAAAVCVLLLISPGDLFDVGFQLSFACVAAIGLGVQPLTEALRLHRERDLEAMTVPASPLQRMIRAAGRTLLLALVASLAAWAAAAPITAWHFGRAGLLGWFSSLLMTPLVCIVTLLGFVKLLLSAIWPSAGAVAALILQAPTNWLADLARALAKLPGSQADVFAPSIIWLLVYYALWAACVLLPRRRWRAAASVVASLMLIPLFIPPPRTGDGSLRVWVLAVGDGNAVIVEFPNGKALACDLGTRSNFDAARSVICPFLRGRRIARLEAADISHPDFDHFGALPGVAGQMKIGDVRLNQAFPDVAAATGSDAWFLQQVSASAIPLHRTACGMLASPDPRVQIERLWPPDDTRPGSLADNDASTVLRITCDDRSILLTGDIVDAAQGALLNSGVDLRADVLLLPHHGSARPATLPAFVEAVDPPTVIRSCGQRDRETDERLWRGIGDRLYYNTAECGAVCVQFAGGPPTVTPHRPSDGRPATAGGR